MTTYRLPHLIGANPAERQAVLYALWLLEHRGVDTSKLKRAEAYTNKWAPGSVRFDCMGSYWKEPIDPECEDTLHIELPGPAMVDWQQRCSSVIKRSSNWKPRARKINGITWQERWPWGKVMESVARQSTNRLQAEYSRYFRHQCGWPDKASAYSHFLQHGVVP